MKITLHYFRVCFVLFNNRGKVSEGIDFRDEKGRVVIITGGLMLQYLYYLVSISNDSFFIALVFISNNMETSCICDLNTNTDQLISTFLLVYPVNYVHCLRTLSMHPVYVPCLIYPVYLPWLTILSIYPVYHPWLTMISIYPVYHPWLTMMSIYHV